MVGKWDPDKKKWWVGKMKPELEVYLPGYS
jgi:hypothetical protein